jgi:hypothetical protein
VEHPIDEVEKRISLHRMELGRIVCIRFLCDISIGIQDGQAVNVDGKIPGRFPEVLREAGERFPTPLFIRKHKGPWRNFGMKFGLADNPLCWLCLGFGTAPYFK